MKPGSSRKLADIGTRRQPRMLSIRVLLLAGVILAVISVNAVPLYQGSFGGTTKAKAASVQVHVLENAIALYQVKVGRYPAQLVDLVQRPSDPRLAQKWDGPYLKVGPKLVDPWEAPYQYAAKGKKSPSGFDVWSLGPDGKDNTQDDIGNWGG